LRKQFKRRRRAARERVGWGGRAPRGSRQRQDGTLNQEGGLKGEGGGSSEVQEVQMRRGQQGYTALVKVWERCGRVLSECRWWQVRVLGQERV
jgi:hypothetical protein